MKRSIAIIVMIGLLLSGCGNLTDEASTSETNSIQEEITEQVLEEFTYEIPESRPNVLINQVGYQPDSIKTAVFRGESLSNSFEVVNRNTGEVVYTGEISQGKFQSAFLETVSYGEFTDITTPGTYYIRTAYIGQSYAFSIQEDIYQNILEDACLHMYTKRCGTVLNKNAAGDLAHGACHLSFVASATNPEEVYELSGGWHNDTDYGKDVSKGCETAATLLLAYELYPEVFHDNGKIPESGNGIPDILDEIKYEIDWLLKMQDVKTGGVFQGVEETQETGVFELQPVSLQATEEFIGVLSKFAYSYKSYDKDYASLCLTAAEKAWSSIDPEKVKGTEDEYFFAAAELYRSVGRSVYRQAVLTALNDENQQTGDSFYRYYGILTYFMTKYAVDVNLCTKQMYLLMEEVEEISSSASSNSYGICIANGKNLDQVLESAMKLTIVEYIITNHEYAMEIENQLHYFLGKNPDGVSYVRNYGNRFCQDNQYMDTYSQRNAQFILVLSEVVKGTKKDTPPLAN